MGTPNIFALNRIEEELLLARLEAARSALSHSGEKGRDLELHVRRLLRDLLPAEYGLATGFIAYEEDGAVKLTSQLDLIVYDAVRYSPLVHLESCDVLPLEAVYGYVEVKASIRGTARAQSKPSGDTLDAIAKQNAAIRKVRIRAYRQVHVGSPLTVESVAAHWLPVRAYVVAFEARGRMVPKVFAQRLAQAMKRQGNAHIHGVLIPGFGFFYTRAVDPADADPDDCFHVKYTVDHPLLAFKSVLLQGLSSFQRAPEAWFPAIDRYLQHKGQWDEQSP
jgi:hypothetical protein